MKRVTRNILLKRVKDDRTHAHICARTCKLLTRPLSIAHVHQELVTSLARHLYQSSSTFPSSKFQERINLGISCHYIAFPSEQNVFTRLLKYFAARLPLCRRCLRASYLLCFFYIIDTFMGAPTRWPERWVTYLFHKRQRISIRKEVKLVFFWMSIIERLILRHGKASNQESWAQHTQRQIPQNFSQAPRLPANSDVQ